MKAILFLLMITGTIYSQSSQIVADRIQRLENKNTHFEKYSLFTLNNNYQRTEYQKTTRNGNIVVLDLKKVNQIISQKHEYLELEVPYNNQTLSVQLYKVDITTSDFEIKTSGGEKVTFENHLHYRGIIKGDRHSLVSMNFTNNEINGLISADAFNNLNIGKLQTEGNLVNYIIFSDSKLNIKNTFKCGTKTDNCKNNCPPDDEEEEYPIESECLTLYLETDYDIFLANQSDAILTAFWLSSIFNNVQTLYGNDGISLALQSAFLWTTIDPYTGTNSLENLELFKNTATTFTADAGQLLTIDGNYGGRAYISTLCTAFNHGYSDLGGIYFNNVPIYSWSVMVIAHELGHNVGSPHTHDCFWNGNNTAIDGCGPTANIDYKTGDCAIGPIPDNAVGGTIMSYCHLLSAGINLANGFGPQPTEQIINTINAASCMEGDCQDFCTGSLTNLKLTKAHINSVILSWDDSNSDTESWEIMIRGNSIDYYKPWFEVSSKTPEITGLQPNTYYTIFVRPVCPNGAVGAGIKVIIATADDFCAGKIFTDNKGPDKPYENNESWIRTVAPLSADDKIKVAFTMIDLESGYDYLYIYEGPDTTAKLVTPAGITGNIIEDPYESKDPTGALTFKFTSDGSVTGAGWEGYFSCATLGVNGSNYIDFTYYPNPVKNIISIASKDEVSNLKIFDINGKLLYSAKNQFYQTSIDLSNYEAGTYIFSGDFNGKSLTFKVLKE